MERTNSIFSNAIAALIMVAGIAAVAYFIGAPALAQANRNMAVNGCLEASATKIANTDQSTWEGPNQQWFDLCMQAKGYK